MNIFLEEKTKPLNLKRKLLLWAMIFTLTPLLAFIYGKHEYKQSDIRRASLPVEIALPEQLPNIYDF